MAGSMELASSTLGSLATAAITSAMAAATATDGADPLAGTSGHCIPGNAYDGYFGARVSSIFVILIGSMLGMFILSLGEEDAKLILSIPGACFPVFAARHKGTKIPPSIFFVAKFFGSGVIIATAFIHVSRD